MPRPSVFLAQLHGGPFDGYAAELVATPAKIVVARSPYSRDHVRIGDYDYNPPPWPAEYEVQVYRLEAVQFQIARYSHATFTTAVNQRHAEAA